MKQEKITMLHRFLLTFTLYLCFSQSGKAQESNTYSPSTPVMVPPSPISQTYQHFMGFHPDLATGAVNVTIPLHTISYDDFTLPFALNYQSNGIKRDAPHYPLGYGWGLHPGLRITRSILGKPDDLAPQKARYYNEQESNDCYFSNMEQVGRMEDSKFDVFTLSLPQGQANFIVKETMPGSRDWKAITAGVFYKIEPLQSSRTDLFFGFKVTDEKGIIYYFGEESPEKGTANYTEHSYTSGRLLPTTYLLRTVKLPGNKNQEILFDWNKDDTQCPRNISYLTAFDGYNILFHSDNYWPETFPNNQIQYSLIDGPQITGSALQKITLPNGTINFNYDINGLHYMSIANASGRKVNDISFQIKENLLESVKNDDEEYRFHYNEKRFDTTTYDQDFWGYYNGAGRDPSLYTHPAYDYRLLASNSLYHLAGTNREPNNNYIDANILEKIDYPTGGYTSFEYEPHRYLWEKDIHTGGGLRLKRIISSPDNGHGGGNPIIKEYRYGRDECGYGSCSVEPNEKTFISELFHQSHTSDLHQTYRQVTIHPNSLYSEYLQFNLPIWYNNVTEYAPSNGKTSYEYKYEPDDLISYNECNIHNYLIDAPNFYYNRNFSLRAIWQYLHIFDRNPLLTKKLIYDANGFETYKEECTYQFSEDFPNENLQNVSYTMIYKSDDNSSNCRPNADYDFLFSPVLPRAHVMSSKVITENGVTTRTNYQYNRTKSYKRIETIHSDSTIIVENFLYEDDNLSNLPISCTASGAILRNAHRSILPICISKSVNGKRKERKIIQYSAQNNNYVYPSEEYFQMNEDLVEKRIEYSRHNDSGKPVEIKKDNRAIVCLWGYSNQYPIAQIENCTYDEVLSIIGGEALEEISSAIAPNERQWQMINSLRKQLPDVMVSTYTYLPLVGLLSETDPSGATIYYNYNKAGKLIEKYRLDTQSGNKEYLENYEYQY